MSIVTYPDKFFRGIKDCYIDEGGYLLAEAFQLDPVRDDGYCEISITWDDEPDAFQVIASQTKEEGIIQFQHISEIQIKELVERMAIQIRLKNLSYERKPSPENKYHGNLLVLNSLDKARKTLIKSQLAMLGTNLIHPNPYVKSSEAELSKEEIQNDKVLQSE